MGKGQKWESKISVYKDHISGATVTKLTDYNAHNFHLYFTNDGWYDNHSKLLIASDRGNATNLFSIDLSKRQLTQLTALDSKDASNLQGTYINPVKNEAYFILNRTIVAINLETYEEKVIYASPEGYNFSNISCLADGSHLCFGLSEDLTKSIHTNLSGGYIGFEEIEVARPHCKICLFELETGKTRIIHEEKRWIGHVNASPTQSHLITFCHEGPWEKVDHRMWAMNLETGDVWKVREGMTNQYAGHEYWHSDGLRIGYHGFTGSLDRKDGKFLGSVRVDHTDYEEFEFPYQNMHIHSNDMNLIVGDG